MFTKASPESVRVKKAMKRMNKVTTPVVTDILAIAQRSVGEALTALKKAESAVPKIAEAAVDVGAAQADLLASAVKRDRT